MKKIILFVASSLFLSATSWSQVMATRDPFVNVGVKLGGNFEHISGSTLKGSIGGVGGIYVYKSLIGSFGVQLEATVSTAQYETKYPAANYVIHTPGMDTVTKGKFQMMYGNVPLLIEYAASDKLRFLLGPQFTYVLSMTDQNTEYQILYGNMDIFKKIDFSVVAGAEFVIKKKFSIGARLVKGVLDVNNSTYYLVRKPWATTGAQLSISYRIM